MTALAGVELESLVSEPDALTTRPPYSLYFLCPETEQRQHAKASLHSLCKSFLLVVRN